MLLENNWVSNFKEKLNSLSFDGIGQHELEQLAKLTNNNEKEKIIKFWINHYYSRAHQAFDTLKDTYHEVVTIVDLYKESINKDIEPLYNSLREILAQTRIDIQAQQIQYLIQTKFHLEYEYNQRMNRILNLEKQNEQTRAEFHALHELGIFISSTLLLDNILKDTIDGIIGVLDIPCITILLFNKKKELILKELYGLEQDATEIKGQEINIIKGGLIQQFIDTRRSQPFKVDDVWQNEKISEELKKISPLLRSAIISSLIIADELLGFIIIGSTEPNSLTIQIYDFIKVIVPHVASAINNAKLYNQINEQAITDALTDLYNRRHFQDQYKYHFEYARRYSHPLSVLMIDIDNFKKFNDTYGHDVGDFVLKNIAKIILTNVRTTDIVARYGGEEIIVLLTETPKKAAKPVAERLVKAVGLKPFIMSDDFPELYVTISVGYATFPDDSYSAIDLVNMADKGMYKAKNSGKNQVGHITN